MKTNIPLIIVFVIALFFLFGLFYLLHSETTSPSSSGIFNSFQIKSDDSSSFVETNSLVSKVAFVFLVLFLFIVLLRFGISFISWIMTPSSSTNLIRGMVDGKQTLIFPQDPKVNNAVTIYRSTDGLDYTWSVWIFIEDLQYLNGQYRHIFSKGNSDVQSNGMVFPNNAPGLYIAPNRNDLVVVMNSYHQIQEEIIIPDVPLNKWINVIIRGQNKVMDVYINGTISRSLHLEGVPKQNYGDVYVALNGGFSGHVSDLRYENHALSISSIQKIVQKGPNTHTNEQSDLNQKNVDYLSLRWYLPGVTL